jgi:molybdopterin-binding protein
MFCRRYHDTLVIVTQIRIRDAAQFLGVSTDTVRRWIDDGTLSAARSAGVLAIDGLELARLARERAVLPADPHGAATSARNRFVGLVTEVISDRVMSQVELQCGPHRVVSLMSSEAVCELGIEPGTVAVAVIKATNVIVETSAVETASEARSTGGHR